MHRTSRAPPEAPGVDKVRALRITELRPELPALCVPCRKEPGVGEGGFLRTFLAARSPGAPLPAAHGAPRGSPNAALPPEASPCPPVLLRRSTAPVPAGELRGLPAAPARRDRGSAQPRTDPAAAGALRTTFSARVWFSHADCV